jgi:hypothetical protein
MVIGSALLAICLWDNLIRMVFTGQSATEGEAEETARTE